MNENFRNRIEKSFLHIKDNKVIYVNLGFEFLTGYCTNELSGKTISDINKILRVQSQLCIEKIESCEGCYIFTKKYNPRYVIITCNKISENEQLLYFEEKKKYRLCNTMSYEVSPLLSDEVGVGIYSMPDGILLKYSKKYNEFINKKGNYLGKDYKSVFPDSNEISNTFETVVRTGKTIYLKEIKYNNSKKYWGESFVPIYMNGEGRYIIHTVHDITDRINSRNIIAEQNQELNAIIENICEEIIIVDKIGNVVNANKIARNVAKAKNIKEYEIYFKNSKLYYLNGNAIAQEDSPIQKVIKGEIFKSLILEINNDNTSQYKEINGTPIYDSSRKFVAGVISMRDVTDNLYNAEYKFISTQYDLLNGIINNFGLGYLRFTYPDFIIKECNKKVYIDIAGQQSQLQLHEVNGVALTDLFPENHEEKFYEFIKSVAANRIIQSHNMKINNKESEKTIKLIYQPLLGINGQTVEIAVLTFDITEEVNDKEKIRKALKIQDEIFTNAAHELKTPISVIYSANQIMDIYLNNDNLLEYKQKIIDYNNIVKQNCFRLTRLVNNVVDITKGNSGVLRLNLNNVDIVELVKNIVQATMEYIKEKDLEIIFSSDIESKLIACDASKIDRVMLNLISNAIKFSDSKGKIYINVIDKNNEVEITVKDEGIGIDSKHMDYIFQKYYQADKSLSRKAEGTGIGLPLVKKIIDLHGGNISVDSEVGKGSVFKITLPATLMENTNENERISYFNKNEMVNIEFSDIYIN